MADVSNLPVKLARSHRLNCGMATHIVDGLCKKFVDGIRGSETLAIAVEFDSQLGLWNGE